MAIDLEKLQTANWYEQDTKTKVITIDAAQFKEIIQALEQAKEIIEKEEKDPYCCCETNRIWLTKFFPTQTKESGEG